MRDRDQVFLLTCSDLQPSLFKAKRGFLTKKMSEYKHNLAGEPALKPDCKNSLKTTDMWRLQ